MYDRQARWEMGDKHYAVGFSPDQTRPERFQGFHAATLVFIIDEASGVPQAHWDAIAGSALAGNTAVLAIGNPTRLSGTFYDAFTTKQASWRRISISAFDTPNFQPSPTPFLALGERAGDRGPEGQDGAVSTLPSQGRVAPMSPESGRGEVSDGRSESAPDLAAESRQIPHESPNRDPKASEPGVLNPPAPDAPSLSLSSQQQNVPPLSSVLSVPSVVNLPLPFPELVGPAQVEDARRDWGEGSNQWRIRILGEFPTAAENTLIDLAWLDAVQQVPYQFLRASLREPGLLWSLGVDVARSGADQTALVLLKGNALHAVYTWRGQDTMRTAAKIRELRDTIVKKPEDLGYTFNDQRTYAWGPDGSGIEPVWFRDQYRDLHATFPTIPAAPTLSVCIDDGGVGGGVVDRLNEMRVYHRAISFGASPTGRMQARFKNKLSELYWVLAQELKSKRIRIPPSLPDPTPSFERSGREGVGPSTDRGLGPRSHPPFSGEGRPDESRIGAGRGHGRRGGGGSLPTTEHPSPLLCALCALCGESPL